MRNDTPFDPGSYTDVLKLIAGNVDSEGAYHEVLAQGGLIPALGKHLVVTDAWVLMSRPRAINYLFDDLKRLQDKLEDGCEIFSGPLSLVTPPSDQPIGFEPISFRGLSSRGSSGTGGTPEELYFPLPYNDEQVTIVQRLKRAAGVTVQGPPGTGKTHTIAAQTVSPQNHPLTYSYSATAGNIPNGNATAVLGTFGVGPGVITVTCNVVDDLGKSASATTSVTVIAPPPAVVAIPEVRNLCSLSFERDRKRPERVDNEAKACLDDIALQMQHDSAGRLVIVGSYSADERPKAASERTLNAERYLIDEKGVDASRIELRTGIMSGSRTATDIFVPEDATYPANDTIPVETTIDHHEESHNQLGSNPNQQ